MKTVPEPEEIARRNLRAFTLFRMFFTARFYYPVYALLFLDYGLTLEQFGILNGIWAVTIVLLEVPSGALADTFGRRKLLVVASICMVLEMVVLLMAPINGGNLMFTLFALNRILSGIAEAAASGADEALAYDSLKAVGQENRWGHVLERVQRMTSLAFFFAMMIGSAVYDAGLINAALQFVGVDFSVEQEQLIKLPILLTFCSSLVVLSMAMYMFEAPVQLNDSLGATLVKSWRQTLLAINWVWMNTFAFGVILGAMILDSVIRQFLTLASEYWNVIELPVVSYGIIGSGMAIMGFFTPRIARLLAEKFKPAVNFSIVCTGVLIGLFGLSIVIPYWGILPAILLFAGMQLTNYLVSRYLNEVAPSGRRATILSLRGFSTNFIYGTVSFMYSGLIIWIRSGRSEESIANDAAIKDSIFIESLGWGPWYFLISIVICVLSIRLQMARLSSK
ncbi:MAG: MFS family permease [Lentimonas sp.]|jgi:MFS family permease